jgi:hypothetical protein
MASSRAPTTSMLTFKVWSSNAHWSRRHGIQTRGDLLFNSASSVRDCGHAALSRRRYGICRVQ